MKKNNTKTNDFIPALKYPWLTRFYDPVLNFTMPERKFKAELIRQAGIQPNHHVLDFGCGSATLSLMLKMTKPQTVIRGVDVDDKNIAIAKRKIGSAQADIYMMVSCSPTQTTALIGCCLVWYFIILMQVRKLIPLPR